MNDRRLPVVVVHGIGSGHNADRAGFSRDLSNQVHEPARPVIRVGPSEQSAPNPLPENAIVWEEALWENANDNPDTLTATILKAAVKVVPPAWLAAKVLDILGDVPFYLSTHGPAIRKAVRDVIAQHPQCVVVGHSLGSVIAADILCAAQEADDFASLPVSGFVTLGSPLNILGLRSPMKAAFPFPWKNIFYPADPVCLGKRLPSARFPGVSNQALSAGETFGVAHTSYWQSTVLAGIVYRLSMKGS